MAALNPYRLRGPTCLSFSGGRTSAFMLFMVLASNAPEDVAKWLVICFANTVLGRRLARACGPAVSEQAPKKSGRPALPPGEKLKPVPVRLNDAQKAKLVRLGHQRLRDWLGRVKE